MALSRREIRMLDPEVLKENGTTVEELLAMRKDYNIEYDYDSEKQSGTIYANPKSIMQKGLEESAEDFYKLTTKQIGTRIVAATLAAGIFIGGGVKLLHGLSQKEVEQRTAQEIFIENRMAEADATLASGDYEHCSMFIEYAVSKLRAWTEDTTSAEEKMAATVTYNEFVNKNVELRGYRAQYEEAKELGLDTSSYQNAYESLFQSMVKQLSDLGIYYVEVVASYGAPSF